LVPERKRPEEIMIAIVTLALGLAIFGLFFAIVAACDQL
jgi:hypothetical protein